MQAVGGGETQNGDRSILRPTTIVVTACDGAHAALAEDLFASILAVKSRDFALGFVRIDRSSPAQPTLPRGVLIADAAGAETDGPRAGYRVAFLNVKGSLPRLFPGFEVYIWIDADCWVQNEEWYEALLQGAGRADLCAHPEVDVHYLSHQTPNDRTVRLYLNLFGGDVAQRTWRYPMINAGVFAARAHSPVWDLWSATLKGMREIDAADPGRTLFFSDQVPLHQLVYSDKLTLYPLRAVHNWQAFACLPGFDIARRRLTLPTAPFEEIGLIHLAGDAKHRIVPIPAAGRQTGLRYRDVQAFFDSVGTDPAR